ncbi:MAG: hypothetical protein AB3X44_07720 [Leptothrix sp. (in: b-proteobacteria)]
MSKLLISLTERLLSMFEPLISLSGLLISITERLISLFGPLFSLSELRSG